MKKVSILFAAFLLFVPTVAGAIDLGGNLVKKAAVDEAGFAAATETTFAETLGSIIRTALSFVGVLFMILMVYAGYMWMSARGDEEKVNKAQKIIRGAVIGLIITVGAHSITSFVVPRILKKTAGQGAPGGGEVRVPCCVRAPGAGGVGQDQCQVTQVADQAECTALNGNFTNLPASECSGVRSC